MTVKIAIIADEKTVSCFKLVGLEPAFTVRNAEEAEKLIQDLAKKEEVAIVITTDEIANKIRGTINEVTEEHKYPLVVSIPSGSDPLSMPVDPITELIKRKIGIELK